MMLTTDSEINTDGTSTARRLGDDLRDQRATVFRLRNAKTSTARQVGDELRAERRPAPVTDFEVTP